MVRENQFKTFAKRMLLLLFFAMTVTLLLVGSSLSWGALNQTNSATQGDAICGSTPPSSELILDWAYRYGSIASMRTAADTIIVGQVLSEESFVNGHACTLIYTKYTVLVRTAMHGAIAGSVISIVQTGGVLGASRQEARDDPLMSVGNVAVMFLHLNKQTGSYAILSGPEGRFPVTNGLVYSLNVLYPDRPIDLPWRISGDPVDTFIAEI